MSNALKITVMGEDGRERAMSFDLSKPVLVGRTHLADVRLTEADVSGRHFEFVGGASGCEARVLSRNGMVVDGKVYETGVTVPLSSGSVIAVGSKARIRVDGLPLPDSPSEPAEDSGFFGGSQVSAETPSRSKSKFQVSEVTSDASNPFANADETAPVSPAFGGGASPEQPDDAGGDDCETFTGVDESLTGGGDGETLEMKTRIGSLEEIVERKRQLDRTKTLRRVRITALLTVFSLGLAGVWLYLGWGSHGVDVRGPFLPNGDYDESEVVLKNEDNADEIVLIYPRNDDMKVSISSDSNTVEVSTFFGPRSDVPYHLEFLRWNDRSDLMRSLEESFERWMAEETASGYVFETHGGGRPAGDFFENVFSGFCDIKTQRGVRFVRAEYTRSRGRELWRGICVYFRKGDRIYLLKSEIPDMFWKIASTRITQELHMGLCEAFSDDHWDSPGRLGVLNDSVSDYELMLRIKRELSADRVASWHDLAAYIDTLLVRSWGVKPRIQKEAVSFFMSMQANMIRFYNERLLAYSTARANGDEKRMKSIFIDCKTAFGALPNDRRSTLVNDPEVWSCRQRR